VVWIRSPDVVVHQVSIPCTPPGALKNQPVAVFKLSAAHRICHSQRRGQSSVRGLPRSQVGVRQAASEATCPKRPSAVTRGGHRGSDHSCQELELANDRRQCCGRDESGQAVIGGQGRLRKSCAPDNTPATVKCICSLAINLVHI
jgi:hypothetical protein